MEKEHRQLRRGSALRLGAIELMGQPDGPRGRPPNGRPAQLRNGTDDPVGAWTLGFPSVRWAQTQSLSTVPDSFQAVVLDTPSPSGAIHSCFKQPVGARLARGALAVAYGRPKLHIATAVSAARRVGTDQLAVTVANTSGATLTVRASLGFEVLVARDWHSAPIVLCDGRQTLTLALPNATAGAALLALRYLWTNKPCGGGTFSCPVYVSVPKLGALTGENDTLPLSPAMISIQDEAVDLL